MNRKIFTPFDIILSGAIIFFCIVWIVFAFCFKSKGNRVVISVDNEILTEFSLNEETIKEIETDYGKNTVCIKNGVCYISEADCEDGICKKHSAVKNKGETIVCLPHKLIVEVK